MGQPRRHGLITSLQLIVLLLTVFGLFWLSHPSSVNRAITLSTSRQYEPFTELAFADYPHLEKQLTPQQTYLSSFLLANHETSTTRYTYRVTTIETTGSRASVSRIATGQVKLAVGESIKIPFSYVSLQPNSNLTVTISLMDKPEVIHFAAVSGGGTAQ